MKKMIKLLCLLMALLLTLTMFAGCKASEDEEEAADDADEPITVTIGLPVGPNDEEWPIGNRCWIRGNPTLRCSTPAT